MDIALQLHGVGTYIMHNKATPDEIYCE